MRITRAVRTNAASPAQWDAWTAEGRYLYLRYRFGVGTVEDAPGAGPMVKFGRLSMAGEISLAEFCEQAGLELSPGVDA